MERKTLAASFVLVFFASLFSQTSGQEKSLAMISDEILTLAWSPDGNWIGGGGLDGTLRIWNAKSGMVEADLPSPRRASRAVAFSSDGARFASACDDMQARVWDTKTWKLSTTLGGHQGSSVGGLAFSPNTTVLAVSSTEILAQGQKTNTEIRLWNPSTGNLNRTIKLPGETVRSVVFSPDGKSLCVAAEAVLFVDPETGDVRRRLKPDFGMVIKVAVSPDGKTCFGGGGFKQQADRGFKMISEVYVWSLESGKLLRTIKDLNPWLRSMAVSPDGKLLGTGTMGSIKLERGSEWASSELRLWDAASGKLLTVFEGKNGEMHALAFAPDGKTVVCSDSQHVYLVDTESGQARGTLHQATMKPLKN